MSLKDNPITNAVIVTLSASEDLPVMEQRMTMLSVSILTIL